MSSAFNETTECPRCQGDGVEDITHLNPEGRDPNVIDCRTCEGGGYVSLSAAREYLRGDEGNCGLIFMIGLGATLLFYVGIPLVVVIFGLIAGMFGAGE